MISHAPKRSFFMKAVSVFLTLTFLMYNVSFAAPESAAVQATPQAQSAPAEQGPINADDVGIAIDAGTIKAKHNGTSGKIVVHIQDAHCNFEAQGNINRMLEQLTKECGVNIISVEGAEGIVDTTWFKAFPDSEIRKEVATYFMKKGEITGAEFFSITSDYNGTIFGAETRDYYVKNLKAFTEVYPYKDAIEKFFKETRGVADKLKGVMYPADLRELDSKINAFKSKEIELAAFAEFVFTRVTKLGIKLDQYPNFKKLTGTLEYEKKINFDIVDQERSNYIDALSKKLTKKQMAELVGQSLKFKKGHIKAVEFYSYLRDLAKDNNIPIVQEYPNLFYYYIYTKLYDGIDNEALFKEIDQLEMALKKKLFKSSEEEQLDKVSTLLKMYTDLVNIELTNEDYDLYKAYSKEFSLDAVMAFLKKYCDKYALNVTIEGVPSDISTNMPKMVDFYEIAMKRDNALIDNTLRQMEKEGKSRSVLIAGGFHTRGIKELLEKKGYSYVVVTPKITKDVETPYIKVLTNQRTSLEDIITDSAAMPGMGITASKEEVVRAKSSGTMLSPLNKVFYTIPMMVDDPRELRILSEAIGAVQGRTLWDAANQSYKDMVRALVTGWLMKAKGKADPTVWADAVQNWQLLLGAFLKQYSENLGTEKARAEGLVIKPGFQAPAVVTNGTAQGVLETVNDEFAEIFKSAVADAQKASPGSQAVRIDMADTYESLTEDQAKALDGVIAGILDRQDADIFAATGEMPARPMFLDPAGAITDNVRIERLSMSSKYQGRRGLGTPPSFSYKQQVSFTGPDGKNVSGVIEVRYLEGLRDAVAAHNAESAVKIPADVRVHPGRGGAMHQHALRRMYIDKEDYTALTPQQLNRLATHEFCHIINPELTEDQVCALLGDRLDDVRAVFAMNDARKAGSAAAAEKALSADTAYGDTAARHIREAKAAIDALRAGGDVSAAAAKERELAAWMETVKTRRDNIDAMQKTLTAKNYDGYDIIIVSSSTPDEVKYQQEVLEKLFEGRKTDNGAMNNKVCILSVLDESEGGQIIGQANTWRRAAEMFAGWARENGLEYDSLDDIFKQDNVKIAVYHNGGKGERASPATQSLGNSRGAQKIVGSVTKADGTKSDIELIPAVILSTAGAARTNDRSRIDTYWANQVSFGTENMANLVRSNAQFDKFVVKVPAAPNKKDLFDYGTAVIDAAGRIVKFLANKVLTARNPDTGKFEDNPKFASEMKDLMGSANGSFDFGSFSMSREMHYALMEYWTNKGIFKKIDETGKAGMSRDIDPALVQVIVPLANGLAGKTLPEGLVTADGLKAITDQDAKTTALEGAYAKLKAVMEPSFAAAVDKIYADPKKKDFVLESVEFFILYPQIFADLNKVVGSVNLGADSHWFAYKRMLDLSNEKFFMLSDILGKNIELETDGSVVSTPLAENGMDAVKAEDARRVRGITNDAVCSFVVNGQLVRLSYDQVKAGWTDTKNDIYVKGSIIQGTTVLLPGSRVVNSVVNDSQGKIVAENSYIESSTKAAVNAVNSIIFKAADASSISANKEIVADAYRPVIVDARFPAGQTRMRAAIGYDPKGKTENDTTVFGDNKYTFQAIRDMECNRTANDAIELANKDAARTAAGIILPAQAQGASFAAAYAAVVAEDAERIARIKDLDARIKPLKNGTSGMRGPVTEEEAEKALITPEMTPAQVESTKAYIRRMIAADGKMTDMECYINVRGFIKFLVATGDAKSGDKIAFGGDLRPTTPRIALAILQAIKDEGCVPDYVGSVSSPALAYYALKNAMPSIMITGSHIPDDRNGIKFTKKSGEVLKSDETEIAKGIRQARNEVYGMKPEASLFDGSYMFKPETKPVMPEYDANKVMDMYVQRYLDAMPADYLKGLKIAVYQHSAVGRDALVRILEGLGAEVIPFGRSDKFVPVDTEKVSAKTKEILKQAVRDYSPDIIVTKDGDSDRPLFATENGDFLTGDRLGGLVTKMLKPQRVAVPCTTNNGVLNMLKEQGVKVTKTKVGSPYIVDAMNRGAEMGWEANGGFLLGGPVKLDGWKGRLEALPTRDASLPLILAARYAKERNQKASEMLRTALPPWYGTGVAVTDRTLGCESYSIDMGAAIMTKLSPPSNFPKINEVAFMADGVKVQYPDERWDMADPAFARELLALRDKMASYFTKERGFPEIAGLEIIDGVKVIFADGNLMHVRASGNAADFRGIPGTPTEEGDAAWGKLWETIGPEIIRGEGYPKPATATPGVRAIRTQKAPSDAARRVGDAILSGKPFEIVPYVEPKVWGVDGKGEYWYGAEAGKKSSIVVVGNDRVPMAEVMAIMPEEVLGTGVLRSFGDGIPLVKILTPAARLSAQYHDSKDELWIVTRVTGENPTIILGFSAAAVAKHGDQVAEKYKQALQEYGRALNNLINTLEKKGFKDLLNEQKDAAKAASILNKRQDDFPGRAEVDSAYAGYLRVEGALNSFYNYRSVQAGDVIPIPAYTLHALGAGVEIIEPQIAGPTQSLEDGATFPVRYHFPGYKRDGAQKELDVERVGEMRTGLTVEDKPVVIAETDGVKIERLPGGFEDKGLEVHRITMKAGSTMNVPAVTSFHTLVAIGGKAKVIVGDVEYTIPQASADQPMLIIPATAKSYRIVADSDVEIIDTFSPVPSTSELSVNVGTLVPGTSEPSTDERVVFADFGAMTGTFDKLYIIREMPVPAIVRNRPHTIVVQEGTVSVIKADGVKAADLIPGQKFTFPENFGAYTLAKVGDMPVSVKVDYEKNPAEKTVYATYEAVKKHMKEIQAGPVDLILPKEMFVPGGESTVGSALWEQKQLQTYVSPNIRIRTYSANVGLSEAAKMSVLEGTTGILVATESNIKNADKNDQNVTDFLQSKKGKVRVLAIPDIDTAKDEKGKGLDDKGWFFNREVVGTGLLLAAVNPDTIDQENQGNAADDLQKLMTQLTGRAIPRQYMYYMLAYDEMTGALANLPEGFRDSLGWLRFIVQNLLLKMPIKPFDATEQLQQRRKVMWSV